MARKFRRPAYSHPKDATSPSASLRIVGGQFRGRRLAYQGDPRTRPMKDRVREAVFNLLGPSVKGKLVLDLFAGTGALALEALSRGAAQAVLIECHYPTVRLIEDNVAALEVADRCQVLAGDAFFWARQPHNWGVGPWLTFCSPPYDFYVDRAAQIRELVTQLMHDAPAESIIVVEADQRFDLATLPDPGGWTVRQYPPASVAIHRDRAAPAL